MVRSSHDPGLGLLGFLQQNISLLAPGHGVFPNAAERSHSGVTDGRPRYCSEHSRIPDRHPVELELGLSLCLSEIVVMGAVQAGPVLVAVEEVDTRVGVVLRE